MCSEESSGVKGLTASQQEPDARLALQPVQPEHVEDGGGGRALRRRQGRRVLRPQGPHGARAGAHHAQAGAVNEGRDGPGR